MTRARRTNEPARGEQRGNAWAEYERRKRRWEQDNPQAAPAEHDRAMRRILDDLGL